MLGFVLGEVLLVLGLMCLATLRPSVVKWLPSSGFASGDASGADVYVVSYIGAVGGGRISWVPLGMSPLLAYDVPSVLDYTYEISPPPTP